MKRPDFVSALVVVTLGLAVSALGCDSAEKHEAEQVIFAVEFFRKADNASKPAAVESLRSVKCTATEVCRTRDACLASAEATARALRLKSEVEQGLDAIEKGKVAKDSEEARLLPFKLDEAENLLKEGFDRLGPCDDQIMALKRKHKI